MPVPPLDGGNVLAGLLPAERGRRLDRCGPSAFIILYGLMFTGILSAAHSPPTAFLLMELLFP